MTTPSSTLAAFAAQLQYDDIPSAVVHKTEDLLVDWFGSVIAGHDSRPVDAIARFALSSGPADGPSDVINERRGSSPYLAAMANAAASHVAEQDDVHSGSVFRPATVAFSGRTRNRATGRRERQGISHGGRRGLRSGHQDWRIPGPTSLQDFHTTATAGTLAAAAAARRLLNLSPKQMLHAFGSAGTTAAGLWEFLRTAADFKPLHTAHAASTGLMAACLAGGGLTGAAQILEGPQGMAAGVSGSADVKCLIDRLGTRWATAETSFKYHASCRHARPAAEALLQVMRKHELKVDDIVDVTALVHQGAIDVPGPVVRPATVHHSKFSMGTVLALVAQSGHAVLSRSGADVLDPEVDGAHPVRWIGKVEVCTRHGRTLQGRVDEPKGDPGNSLNRDELAVKAHRLARYSGGATDSQMSGALKALWAIAAAPRVEFIRGAGG